MSKCHTFKCYTYRQFRKLAIYMLNQTMLLNLKHLVLPVEVHCCTFTKDSSVIHS